METARTIQGVSFNGTANITLSVVDKDSGTGSATLPAGTTAQRTASPVNGQLRYNSDNNEFEGYINGAWGGIGGGTPLFTVLWWPSRTAIPAGYVPADGQLLTRATYNAAWPRISAGDVPFVTDATWLATSTSRGSYSNGDGSTTFRVPDLNGKTAGTTAAPFLRGDGTSSTGVAGQFQSDALQNMTGQINFHGSGTATMLSGTSGVFTTAGTRTSYLSGTNQTGANSYDAAVFNASAVARTATETRPVNVTGVFVIKLIGGASDLTQEDASVAVAALEDKLQFVSGKNRIINGDCRISQRATVTATSASSVYGGVDRFRAVNGNGGGSFTQSRTTMTVNGVGKLAVRHQVVTAMTNSTGTNYWGGINQLIEGLNCYDFIGKPIVASFIFNTNVSGTYSISMRDSANSKSYVSTFVAVANTPVKVVLPLAPVPVDAVIPNTNAAGCQIMIGTINTGTYQTSSLNGWQSGMFFSAAGATNWGGTVGNFIEVTDLQIEVGTQATEFEYRGQTLERLMCQRYYHANTVSARFPATAGSQLVSHSIMFAVAMRDVPTQTLLNSGSIQNLASASLSVPDPLTARFEIQSTSAGDCYALNRSYGLDSEL